MFDSEKDYVYGHIYGDSKQVPMDGKTVQMSKTVQMNEDYWEEPQYDNKNFNDYNKQNNKKAMKNNSHRFKPFDKVVTFKPFKKNKTESADESVESVKISIDFFSYYDDLNDVYYTMTGKCFDVDNIDLYDEKNSFQDSFIGTNIQS